MDAIENVVAAVTKYIARRAPEYVDIEDVAQEARIECWQSASQWDASRGASLSAFLYTCGFRAGLRWIRSEAHWRGITEPEYRNGISAPREVAVKARVLEGFAHDDLESKTVSKAYVSAFLKSLSARQRLICRQRLQGLTSDEISHLCGIRSSSVRRQLMNIRRTAREWFDRAGGRSPACSHAESSG